jgi:hypothetical protein
LCSDIFDSMALMRVARAGDLLDDSCVAHCRIGGPPLPLAPDNQALWAPQGDGTDAGDATPVTPSRGDWI